MLLYVAGKYSAPTVEETEKNIRAAYEVADKLWGEGHWVLCPHANSAHMLSGKYEQYLEGYLHMMSMCDGVIFLPEWEKSNGATIENIKCKEWNIPMYYWPCEVPQSKAYQKTSNTALEFRAVLGNMYRVFLKKQSDYSPANILVTGDVGLVTRISDKVMRLLNLSGFNFDVTLGTYNKPANPENESIDDTLLDLANYGAIGILLRKGLWGK